MLRAGQYVFVTLCGALAIWGLVFCQQKFDQIDDHTRKVVEAPPLVDLDPNIINALLLGHQRVYQNILAIWTNQILLSDELNESHADELVSYVEAIAKHKPTAEYTIFLGACFTLVKKLRRPDLCYKVIDSGMEILPQSWKLPLTLGFVEGFILKNYERASFFYYLASIKEGAPHFLKNVVQKFMGSSESPSEEDYLGSINQMFNQPGGRKFREFIQQSVKEQR